MSANKKSKIRVQRLSRILLILLSACSIMLMSCKNDKGANKEEVARFVKSAEAYLSQGQYRASMLEAKNAIQKNPSDSQGYLVLAKIYNSLGAFGATQSLLEPVVKKMPETSLALASAYVETRKYRSALNTLADVNPSDKHGDDAFQKELLAARANIYLGDSKALEKSLTALHSFADKNVAVKLLDAEILVAQGKLEAVNPILEQLQPTEKSDSVKLLLMKGNIALQQNALPQAEEEFTKALGLLPKTDIITAEKLTVLGQLTETLIREGKSGEAYRYQKIIAEANPEGSSAKEKFNDAMELFRQGKFADAEKTLKELREQFPQDKNTAILLGLVEYQKGQDKQAIDLFDQYIDPETTTSTVIQAAALAKFRANKMDDAIALLKKSVENQPENAELLATYGLALLDQDKTSSEGQKALEKSLALNPKQQRLRLALAKRDFEMKNPALGLGQLQKAYNEQPMDLIVQQAYFKALFSEGKLDVIKSEIANFQKNNPANPRGNFLEGWFYLVQKKYPDAEQSFKKALAIKDNNEKNLSYAGLAEVYKSQGQPLKAADIFESMLEADASQASVYSQWLGILQKADAIKRALDFLVKLEAKQENWMPSVVAAQVLIAQRLPALAVKHIDVALERNGKAEQVKKVAANVYQQYGVALVNEKNLPEAKKMILKGLLFDPDNMNVLASLIELEILEKNVAEAQKLLDQYASGAATAERDYLQGIIKAAENKPEDAIALFKSSWDKKPLEISAKSIAAYYQKSNQSDALFSFAEDWNKKLPNSPQAALLLAIHAQQKNDKDSAISWYEKNIELDPNAAASMNNLAWLYYEQKNPKALGLAEKAYKLAANNPSIIDTYAWVLVESGKVSEGYELLQKAATLAPTNKEIQDHLLDAKKRLKK